MTLILEPKTQADYRLFVELAQRLHVQYKEEKSDGQALIATQKEHDFLALAGSWQSDETTDELIQSIERARTSKKIDISL